MTESARYQDMIEPDGRSKIVSQAEFRQWYREGKSYRWMAEYYRDHYKIDITPEAFGVLRNRLGLERRAPDNSAFIPWRVLGQHQSRGAVQMLRLVAREARGDELRPTDVRRLENWRKKMDKGNLVVHYDPDTDQGFWYIPRQEGDEGYVHFVET